MALEKIISGITGETFRTQLNNNFSQLYPILVGTINPTTATVGIIGQEYVNRINGTLFICQSASSDYTWKQIERNDLYPIIVANTPPTSATIAIGEGQQYLNKSNNKYYVCTSIQNNSYNWVIMNNDYVLSTLVNNIAPTVTTKSDGVGQLYINSSNNNLYVCTNVDNVNNQYIWSLLTKVSETNQVIISETQPESQRINDYWFKIMA